ncbi:hypothetical protein INT43_007233 [Umbelopsis isabellina]|uniref:PSI domain-containing protein n=1 Tax=Mortierella isabellina TaxID=91625 RepID=A0A8H7PY73_MORIS|nr:hypothetical protein INT43_007233 [Umbelopsis isabellina]
MSNATNDMNNLSFFETGSSLVCSEFKNCSACVVNPQCGFCVISGQCIPGNWLGPEYMDACTGGRLHYYYGQCIVSHKPILIAGISLLSIAVFTTLVLLLRCCKRSHNSEYRPLLPTSGSGLLRRSSTYYQFNRNVPGSRRKPSLSERPWPNSRKLSGQGSPSSSQNPSEDDVAHQNEIDIQHQNDYKAIKWDERRKELLKKYGKSPDR